MEDLLSRVLLSTSASVSLLVERDSETRKDGENVQQKRVYCEVNVRHWEQRFRVDSQQRLDTEELFKGLRVCSSRRVYE